MSRYADVSGVILAGGRSSRMGEDKALLEIDGTPMIRRLADLLLGLTDDVVISANSTERYAFLNLPVVPDVFPDLGPMSGIHATMVRTSRPLLLALACDMPRIHPGLLRYVLDSSEGFDATVPVTADGSVYPLCGAYRVTCFGSLEHALKSKASGLRLLLQQPALQVHFVSLKDGGYSDSDLYNMNEYKDFRNLLGGETKG